MMTAQAQSTVVTCAGSQVDAISTLSYQNEGRQGRTVFRPCPMSLNTMPPPRLPLKGTNR